MKADQVQTRAWTKRDAIGARGRLQWRKWIVRIHVGYEGHALLLDQVAPVDA